MAIRVRADAHKIFNNNKIHNKRALGAQIV